MYVTHTRPASVARQFIAQTQAEQTAAVAEAKRRESLLKTQSQEMKDAKVREKLARAEWARRRHAVVATAGTVTRAAATRVRELRQHAAASLLARQFAALTAARCVATSFDCGGATCALRFYGCVPRYVDGVWCQLELTNLPPASSHLPPSILPLQTIVCRAAQR